MECVKHKWYFVILKSNSICFIKSLYLLKKYIAKNCLIRITIHELQFWTSMCYVGYSFNEYCYMAADIVGLFASSVNAVWHIKNIEMWYWHVFIYVSKGWLFLEIVIDS